MTGDRFATLTQSRAEQFAVAGWGYEPPDWAAGITSENIWHDACPAFDGDEPPEVALVIAGTMHAGTTAAVYVERWECAGCGERVTIRTADA